MSESIEKELEEDVVLKDLGLTIKNQWSTIGLLAEQYDELKDAFKHSIELSLDIMQKNCPDYEDLDGVPELLNIHRDHFSTNFDFKHINFDCL